MGWKSKIILVNDIQSLKKIITWIIIKHWSLNLSLGDDNRSGCYFVGKHSRQKKKTSTKKLPNTKTTFSEDFYDSTLKTLKFNLFHRSESIMCFVVKSIRIRKLNLIQYKMKLNSIFKLNQFEFLLIQLKNTLLIQIYEKGCI